MSEAETVYAVAELLAELRDCLGEVFSSVAVEGEVGEVFRSRAGHVYFDLVDESAVLRCVIFRMELERASVAPETGARVRAWGGLDVYAARGALQLIARDLRPAGAGDLRAAFEKLKAALVAEGLFDPANKRPLPKRPKTIGLVTSIQGAALHDVARGLERRGFGGTLLVVDAKVQGEGAWRDVARGLALLDARDDVDVIILARGGGSLEDLWTFNTEPLARAIAAAETPVISAIGHAVDWVISDGVADACVSTPTAAAESVVPDALELRHMLAARGRALDAAIDADLQRRRRRLAGSQVRLVDPAARLAGLRERLAATALRLDAAAGRFADGRRSRIAALAGRLDALSPLAVLARGYSVARRVSDGVILRHAADVRPGAAIEIRLAEGVVAADVTGVEE